MNRVKINLNDYKIFIIVFLTVFQLCLMMYYSNFKNDNTVSQELDYIDSTQVTFNEVFDSLDSVENIEVLEIEDLGNEWYMKISITGEKEDIIKVINELKNFKMYKYDIDGNKGVLSVIIELYR